MATEVKLPRLGKSMQDAVIVEYKVTLGDEVKKGDTLFEIETDKAALEVESPEDGFVRHIFAQTGQTLNVGAVVLILAGRDEHIGQSLIDSAKYTVAAAGVQAPAPQETTAPGSTLAETDTRTAPQRPPRQIKLGQTIPLTAKQKLTAQKMLQSMREIPCFHLKVRADVTELVELRSELNKTAENKIFYNDFIMLATAKALQKYPFMTGRLAGDVIIPADSIDIALAVTVPDGLVAPVVRNVSKKDIHRIAAETKTLTEKAQSNSLVPDDLTGACITISNLGTYGIESFVPIVVPGQCSILGVGRIADTCLPDDAISARPDSPEVAVRKLMYLTLSVDHRIANGSYAAQFLDLLKKLLEDTSNFS